jgi:hypothetical protein
LTIGLGANVLLGRAQGTEVPGLVREASSLISKDDSKLFENESRIIYLVRHLALTLNRPLTIENMIPANQNRLAVLLTLAAVSGLSVMSLMVCACVKMPM